MRNNITEFPLNKEDIMRLKPEDICGRVWKESKYGTVADKDLNNDRVKLKVVSSRTQPAKTITTTTVVKEVEEERKNMIAPKIIEKIDDYIEDTAEKVWNILKGVFKND